MKKPRHGWILWSGRRARGKLMRPVSISIPLIETGRKEGLESEHR